MTAHPRMTEADLQTAIIQTAKWLGLLVHHCRPSPTRDGKRYVTHIQGSKGFLDLVIAGPGGVAFIELKSDKGRLSPDQKYWANVLAEAGMEVHLWRPAHWTNGRIMPVLERLAGRRAA